MSASEADCLSRHEQSLSEARHACQMLARNQDPEVLMVRGPHYRALKQALEELEGSSRQIATLRSDARWLRLGILYGGVLIAAKNQWMLRGWRWFGQLTALFDKGLVSLDDLRNRKTGVLSSQPILPRRASEWLHVPSPLLIQPAKPPETVH